MLAALITPVKAITEVRHPMAGLGAEEEVLVPLGRTVTFQALTLAGTVAMGQPPQSAAPRQPTLEVEEGAVETRESAVQGVRVVEEMVNRILRFKR
jgi:hypothetical protein